VLGLHRTLIARIGQNLLIGSNMHVALGNNFSLSLQSSLRNLHAAKEIADGRSIVMRLLKVPHSAFVS
jgi:hypothetical protein